MAILDESFIKSLTLEQIRSKCNFLLERKTDLLDGNIKIAKGSDGVDYIQFSEKIETHAKIMCEKGKSGTYLFQPFKEVIITKPPYEKDQLELAKKVGKTRTLSISTIQDTIFQELISDILCEHSEVKFKNIDLHSYAYRKQKSSKMAVKNIISYINKGYVYILDGDIKGFFDEIDHNLLQEKLFNFFGKENILTQKYLYRFMNVKRIEDGMFKEYLVNKDVAKKRNKGIPQGGVLSGLLANIFLYDFDLYIVNELSKMYNFEYFRYADDFVLMFQTNLDVTVVYEELRERLLKEKLILHPLGEKTRILDLSKDTLDFLGFEISPRYLKIKNANIKKFKHRILSLLKKIEFFDTDQYLKSVVVNINPKINGLENLLSIDGYCQECGNLLKKRSWLGYFLVIDDIRMFRNLDTWIRTSIYDDYHFKTKKYLKKSELLKIKGMLISIENYYYKYKKQEKIQKKRELPYCSCRRYFDKDTQSIKIIKS